MAKQWWYREFPEAAPSGPLTPAQLAALARKGLIEPETEVSPDGERWVLASQVKGLILDEPPPVVMVDEPEEEEEKELPQHVVIATEPVAWPTAKEGPPRTSLREPWYYWFLEIYAMFMAAIGCAAIAGGIIGAAAALAMGGEITGPRIVGSLFLLAWGLGAGLPLLLVSAVVMLFVDIGRQLRRRA